MQFLSNDNDNKSCDKEERINAHGFSCFFSLEPNTLTLDVQQIIDEMYMMYLILLILSFAGHMFSRWWQLKYFLCSPRKLGKMNPFWRAYFSTGSVQPPTGHGFFVFIPKIGEMIQFDDHIFRWVGKKTPTRIIEFWLVIFSYSDHPVLMDLLPNWFPLISIGFPW